MSKLAQELRVVREGIPELRRTKKDKVEETEQPRKTRRGKANADRG